MNKASRYRPDHVAVPVDEETAELATDIMAVTAPQPVRLGASGAGLGTPQQENGDGPRYRLADLSRFQAEPDRFREFGYRATLRSMVDAVMETEAPLREEVLVQRIARAHGPV